MKTMDINEIDRRISEIAQEIDFYSLLTPLNREEEKEKFFDDLTKGQPYNPLFRYKYRDRRLDGKREWLEKAQAALESEDDIQRILVKKVDFIITQLDLLECDDTCFRDIAAGLYGIPDTECLKLAESILSESRDQGYTFPEETVTPDEMASILREDMENRKIPWKCVLSGKIVPKITVSGKDSTIYINSGVNYTAEEVQRLKVHEIQVHVFRGANGAAQPFGIFREGLAGYDETEEGLAMISEDIAGCLKIDRRQEKLYAGRAVCVDYCMNGTFYETFTRLREFFPDYLAYRLAERGKRGLRDTSQKGGFTKGFHYISGWIKVRKYVEEDGDLSILYVGKIGLGDVGAVRRLIDKGVLTLPRYLPEFIK